jgi:cytochrome c oxidase cbb3-type subunit III
MSSPFPDATVRLVLGLVIAVAAIAGCQREQRRFSEPAPAGAARQAASAITGGLAVPTKAAARPYESNAWAVAEGQRLYRWFNCDGCHANGGGGIGPALMDAEWLYGGEPERVFSSIVAGRDNGMPAFGDKITAAQAWQLVAYVRSLSGQLDRNVRPGRTDHMQVKPAEQSTPRERPRLKGAS